MMNYFSERLGSSKSDVESNVLDAKDIANAVISALSTPPNVLVSNVFNYRISYYLLKLEI